MYAPLSPYKCTHHIDQRQHAMDMRLIPFFLMEETAVLKEQIRQLEENKSDIESHEHG